MLFQPRAPQTPQLKALLIQVHNLQLAIPLELLVKVIRTPNIVQTTHQWMGITQYEQSGLLVLDLYHKLYDRPNPEIADHLVILAKNDRQFGIPVKQLPSMINLSHDHLQPLPTDYRDRDALGIASHLFIQSDDSKPIFLLDPDRL